MEAAQPRSGPRAGALILRVEGRVGCERKYRGPGSGPGQVLHRLAARELRLRPMIARLVDPDALERMGAKWMGEVANASVDETEGEAD